MAHNLTNGSWDTVALGDKSSHAQNYENQGGMGVGSHPVPYNPMQSRSGQVMIADPETTCGWVPSTEVEY